MSMTCIIQFSVYSCLPGSLHCIHAGSLQTSLAVVSTSCQCCQSKYIVTTGRQRPSHLLASASDRKIEHGLFWPSYRCQGGLLDSSNTNKSSRSKIDSQSLLFGKDCLAREQFTAHTDQNNLDFLRRKYVFISFNFNILLICQAYRQIEFRDF